MDSFLRFGTPSPDIPCFPNTKELSHVVFIAHQLLYPHFGGIGIVLVCHLLMSYLATAAWRV